MIICQDRKSREKKLPRCSIITPKNSNHGINVCRVTSMAKRKHSHAIGKGKNKSRLTNQMGKIPSQPQNDYQIRSVVKLSTVQISISLAAVPEGLFFSSNFKLGWVVFTHIIRPQDVLQSRLAAELCSCCCQHFPPMEWEPAAQPAWLLTEKQISLNLLSHFIAQFSVGV